ncbi:TPA: hypothetical protein CPT92_04765 [Candidatus Gastranaerophilales bacterium HUM_13]|jgi:AcrR family transcriptional regulator|nr:MAG TPA: hypothetical protein CPT92_04765 [Candidatus Gastranaerophilales bacterium HUM_13]
MYVYDKISLDMIGTKLNLSRRTLFYWKKKYEWDKKRFETERNQELFSEELFNFAQKLMQKISDDIDNNRQTPQSEIYSLGNILKNLPQVKQYENSNQKSKQPKSIGQLSHDMIEKIEREVLGFE